MEKRNLTSDDPGVSNKKHRGRCQLSFTEALAICHTARGKAVECEVLQLAFDLLTTTIKAGTFPPESLAVLLWDLSKILKPSPASLTKSTALQPSSLMSLDAAAVQLLDAIGNLLKKEAGRPLVDSLLAIAQRHIPCQPAGQQRTVYADALAALAKTASFDHACLKTQGVALAIATALQQCFDPAAHESAITMLFELSKREDEAWLQLVLQCGVITGLCSYLCSMKPGSVSAASTAALGNYLMGASSQQFQDILREVGEDSIAFQLAPTLAQNAMLCNCSGYYLWVLKTLVDEKLLSKSTCIQAGAIHAALANLQHPDPEIALDAAELLACVVDAPEAATSLLGSNGIQLIASALAASNEDQMRTLLQLLSFLMSSSVSSTVTRQCLGQRVLCQVQQRCKQLEKEVAIAGDEIRKVISRKASRAASDFAELLRTNVMAEVERIALLPGTERHAVWGGCFLVEHTADDRLRTILLDWGLLQRLCEELGAATPPHQVQPAEAASQADDLERNRAVAGNLLALLNRLKQASHAASATMSTKRLSEALTDCVGEDTILRFPINKGALLGVHRWCEVKLLVEGREFYVLKDALLHASPAFRAMLEGGFSEQEAPEIAIPNVTFHAWTVVMQFVYTGHAVVPPELAQQVLLIANQYLMDALKALCQDVLIAHLTPSNLPEMFALAKDVSAHALQQTCITTALEHWEAGGTFGQAPATGPGNGSTVPAPQREQQVVAMAADNSAPAPRFQHQQLPEAVGAAMQMATDVQKGWAGPPAIEQQCTAAQQLFGPFSSPEPGAGDHLLGAEQHMTTASAVTVASPNASTSPPSMPVVLTAQTPAAVQQFQDLDQQLRQQVAAVLLPLLTQLMEEVLPMGANTA